MLELFAERLGAVDGVLHVAGSRSEADGLVGAMVGTASAAAWEEALPAPPTDKWLANLASHSSAEVSLIVADVGIAETGQIGFAHNANRPREVALLPDRQIVLLARQNLVLSANEVLQRVRAPSVVLIAGPSRTADIEQRMMLGVHAPRSLDVVVYG